MYRTYYDLENVNKFKQDMTEKRRYGVVSVVLSGEWVCPPCRYIHTTM